MESSNPAVMIVAINLGVLALGFAILYAAQRRAGAVAVGVGAAVAAGVGALAVAAYGTTAEQARPWFLAGLALLTLGGPATLLVAAAREPAPARLSWAGLREWLCLAGSFLYEPFAERTPGQPARELARLAAVLASYLAFCWVAAIVIGLFAHLANPAGSFR